MLSGQNMVGNYLSAQYGSITMATNTSQNSLDFIWGSVDNDNQVSLYNGNTLVASYTGAQVLAQTKGNPAYSTALTDIDLPTGETYNKVVFTGGQPFEFDLLDNAASAPKSAPGPVLGATLVGNMVGAGGFAGLWARRRKRKDANQAAV